MSPAEAWFPAALVRDAAAALRRALTRPPELLLVSRFGVEFLGAPARRKAPIECALADGVGRLLARPIEFATGELLAVEVEPARKGALPAALAEALPLLIGGQAGARRVVHLLAAQGLADFSPVPTLATIDDWLRAGDEDPLRHFDAASLGARNPELRGARRERERFAPSLAALLAQHGASQRVVAWARRGPSGATDAELAAAARQGAAIAVEGSAAEFVAARQQGVAMLALALVLDSVDAADHAEPHALATAAATLLPRVAALLEAIAAESPR